MAEQRHQGAAAAERRGTTKIGIVVSDVMNKTVTVRVVMPMKHRKYHRIVRRTSKFLAHDPENRCKTGDTVEIRESRPLSKNKRWRVVRVVRAAELAEVVDETGGAAETENAG